MRARLATGPVCAAATGLLLACTEPAVWRYEEALERTPAAAAHAVHEERLVALMRDVERLRTARLPRSLDPRQEEELQAREVAEVARDLADAAALISEAEPPGLGGEERAAFRALAESLRRASLALADEAPRLSPDRWRARVAEIDATCKACHARFRIPEAPGDDREER